MSRVISVCFFVVLMVALACSAPAQEIVPESTVVATRAPAATAAPMPTVAPTATPIPTVAPAPTPTEIADSTATPIPPHIIPSYVAQVELRGASGEPYGRGAAFLVDRDRGLLATNAHIVYGVLEEQSLSIKVQIGNVWYPAYAKEEWVNWKADVAIIGIDGADVQSLPASARLGEAPREGSEVRVTGYLLESKGQDVNGTYLVPYSTASLVRYLNGERIVNDESWINRALILDSFVMSMQEKGAETFEIPKDMRLLYYKRYIIIEQKELYYDQRFRVGTSGMPVIGEGGEVVAIMSSYLDVGRGIGGVVAFVVPAEEISALLERVNGMRK